MVKCVHCGGDGSITKKYVVVEYLSQTFNASTGTRTDRKEKIHGTLEGSICEDCLKSELHKKVDDPLDRVMVPFFLGGLLAVLGIAFVVAGLIAPAMGKTASIVGGILATIGLSISLLLYLNGKKNSKRVKSRSVEENAREFAGKFIAAGLQRQSKKDWTNGEFEFLVDSLAGYDMRSTQYAIHFIELEPSLVTAKQFSLVQKYGISEKMENELKVFAAKML